MNKLFFHIKSCWANLAGSNPAEIDIFYYIKMARKERRNGPIKSDELEPMSYTNFRAVLHIYAEIKHCDWLLQVMLQMLTNQSALFQGNVVMLRSNLFIISGPARPSGGQSLHSYLPAIHPTFSDLFSIKFFHLFFSSIASKEIKGKVWMKAVYIFEGCSSNAKRLMKVEILILCKIETIVPSEGSPFLWWAFFQRVKSSGEKVWISSPLKSLKVF